jgi:hypothetical protein
LSRRKRAIRELDDARCPQPASNAGQHLAERSQRARAERPSCVERAAQAADGAEPEHRASAVASAGILAERSQREPAERSQTFAPGRRRCAAAAIARPPAVDCSARRASVGAQVRHLRGGMLTEKLMARPPPLWPNEANGDDRWSRTTSFRRRRLRLPGTAAALGWSIAFCRATVIERPASSLWMGAI